MSVYAGTAYDYQEKPNTGVLIANEHYEKIAIPLNAINSDVISKTNVTNEIIKESSFTAMDAFITTLEQADLTNSSGSDCKSNCSGACYGCQTTCTGTCTGNCTGSCTGGCGGDCTAYCASSCANYCNSSCS